MKKYRAKPDFIQRSEPLVPLALKVSAAERKAIEYLAAMDGVSLSAYMRKLAQEAVKRMPF